jgi:hypothetical protein
MPSHRTNNPAGHPKGRTKRVQLRVDKALQLIAQCYPRMKVVSKLVEEYDVGKSTADLYIKMAYEDLASAPQPGIDVRREQMRAAFGLHYIECMAKGRYAAAGQTLDRLARLEGLYGNGASAGRGEAAEQGTDIGYTDPERVRERIRSLVEKHPNVLDAIRGGQPN